MNSKKLFTRILVLVMTVGWLSLTQAAEFDEDDLCAPFMEGKVDPSLLTTMLNAARDGNLYRINNDSSRVGFCVSSKFNEVKGDFKEVHGGLTLAPTTATSGDEQAMIVINTASLDTSGSLIESLIKGKRFFDVDKYPEILFISRGFEWTSRDTATITGDLTVHGVTKPVIFEVTLTPVEDASASTASRLLVKATTTIHRSEFEMDNLSKLVSDSVDLCMSVEVVRYSAT